jgi:hypothetical protein
MLSNFFVIVITLFVVNNKIVNNYKKHQKLVNQVLMELQLVFPEGRFYPRSVGLYYTKRGVPVKVGVPGQADIHGWWMGVSFEIEIKTGTGRQTKDQKKWQWICEELGVIYKVIRGVNEVATLKEDALKKKKQNRLIA